MTLAHYIGVAIAIALIWYIGDGRTRIRVWLRRIGGLQ